MKHKFVLLRDAAHFTPSTMVYTIFVGQSDREQLALRRLINICKAQNFTLMRGDGQCDEFLMAKAAEILPQSAFPLIHLPKATFRKVEKFLSLYHTEGLDAFEARYVFPKGTFRLLSVLDEAYMWRANLPKNRKSSSPAYEPPRKYLNHSDPVSELQQAVVGFIIIAVIFLISGHIEYVFTH